MEYIYEMPAEMTAENEKRGEVRKFSYDTQTYEGDASHPMHKEAWVYLPCGYDESRKYNVLYLLHGGGANQDWWFKDYPDTVTILDNMMAKKICEPCIIVTPTYTGARRQTRTWTSRSISGMSCAGT